MFFSTIELPEPFATALAAGDATTVSDAPADSPEALFGRALAKVAVGRDREADRDFEAAESTLGVACRIERAWLKSRDGKAAKSMAAELESILEDDSLTPILRARASHFLGLAEDKRRRTPAAIGLLLSAAELYHQAGQRLAEAQVYDSLGTVEADRGRLDNAFHFYSLSLVEKSLLHDRPGMALTLGNIGRVHLRAGRFEQARSCFQRDLELAIEMEDDHGRARMLEDLGRVSLGLGDLAEAEARLREVADLACRKGFEEVQLFAQKDLVLTHIAQGRHEMAATELATLREQIANREEPYLRLLASAAEGELLLAIGDPRSVEVLEDAADGFARAELPDLEIPTRIALARALVAQRCTALAEQSLLRGLRLSRSDGYMRYVTVLNEAMASLELVEGILAETSRRIETPIDAAAPSASTDYIIRERLGGGAFGEVFRAYDPQRCREVAIKRLSLQRLYDVKQRTRLLESARVELEAASRVRHPGLVQVFALGTEPGGGTYVVQDYVPGKSLRLSMQSDASAEVGHVLANLQQIAGALAALHAAGVVHRDLKPENILMRDDGSLVLVDFGIAHIMSGKREGSEVISGTMQYMAPEQAAGKRLDGRADLYALGVIGYEWLSGTRPLRPYGTDFRAAAKDLANRRPPPIAEFRPGLDPSVGQLIMSLLEKSPRRRPASAQQVMDTCRQLSQL